MKPEDQVICIVNPPWTVWSRVLFFFKRKKLQWYGPKKDEVMKIVATTLLTSDRDGAVYQYLKFDEYPLAWYNSGCFRKLVSTSKLQNDLSDITIPARKDDD